MKTKIRLLTLFMVGFLLISTISFAMADTGENDDDRDDDRDGVDDDYEEQEEREIEIDVESDKVEINSVSKNKEQEDKFEIDIELSDYIEIEVGFSSEVEIETGGSEIEEESEFEFQVKFKKLIEFVDLNGNNIYDGDDVDEFIQEYGLTSFKPIEYMYEILESGNTLHYVKINTTDDIFVVHVRIVEEFEIVDGVLVTPMQAKIDIEITNFNYLEVDSQLALYIKLESEFEYEYESKTHDEDEGWSENEEGVKTKIKGENGFFTWADWALVDGVEQTVETTPIGEDDDDPEEERIYFNYVRGDHIFHDPKVGFAVLTANRINWLTTGLLIGGTVAVIAIVVLVVVGVRKRK
ncbi:MAG: hypothetical protein JW776_01120 [Candidatus Lokiarchaeota archaeon]|nr:hypothetical protein [Candidatus Lokiarchaeota archaeon]